MDFYTYAYIDGQVHTTYFYHYAVLLGVTLAWLVAGIKYMRNRLQTKYRDLTIIFLLIGIFLTGANWQSFSRTRQFTEDMSRMSAFLENFSYNLNVPKDRLSVNSLRLKNGMVVRTGANEYYSVDFSDRETAYKVERIYMINADVHIINEQE